MQPRFYLIILVCFAVLTSVSLAENGSLEEKVDTPSFPYVARITNDSVNIRSGPGTNYYVCGKLNSVDSIKIVGSQFSWSQIVPPAGSFSWISKQYVSIDPGSPKAGVVTGDSVRVYAGSDQVKPIHSTTMQLKLNKEDKVVLLGEEKGDYYKIVPPSGAYLWVSTQYTKPSSLGTIIVIEPEIQSDEIKIEETKTEPEPEPEPVAVVAVAISSEAEKLEEYYALEKQVEAERAKPMAKQDYKKIKKALAKIAGDKKTGKASRYSEFAIKQVERYELVLSVAKEIELQDAQLNQIKQKIDKARTIRLANIFDLGKFAAIGKFQVSNIYNPPGGPKYYRITDQSKKIICYAVGVGSALNIDLDKFIDQKVGLIGTIEPHLQTKGALVRFTEIAELK